MIIRKIILIITFALVFYFKPIIGYLMFLIFLFEYFWLFYFLHKIFIYRNDYYFIEMKQPIWGDLSVVEIWADYSKLQAFIKIYIFFSKKKFKINNFILFFLIFLFGIPYRILKLLYFFIIINTDTFKTGLELLFIQSFELIKNSKIEIFNKNIYLNCFTLKNFLESINVRIFEQNQLYDFYKAVAAANHHFYNYETQNAKPEKLELLQIVTQDGKIISPHYTWKDKYGVLHATSKKPLILAPTQRFDLPMPSAIKPGANDPATIITKEPKKLLYPIYNHHIYVSNYEIASILSNHRDIFQNEPFDFKYNYDKYQIYFEIFEKHLGPRSKNNWPETLVKELQINCYTNVFLNLNDAEVLLEIENCVKNYNHNIF